MEGLRDKRGSAGAHNAPADHWTLRYRAISSRSLQKSSLEPSGFQGAFGIIGNFGISEISAC